MLSIASALDLFFLKPYCESFKMVCSSKNVLSCIYIIISKVIANAGILEIGLHAEGEFLSLFLYTGNTRANLSSRGKETSIKELFVLY